MIIRMGKENNWTQFRDTVGTIILLAVGMKTETIGLLVQCLQTCVPAPAIISQLQSEPFADGPCARPLALHSPISSLSAFVANIAQSKDTSPSRRYPPPSSLNLHFLVSPAHTLSQTYRILSTSPRAPHAHIQRHSTVASPSTTLRANPHRPLLPHPLAIWAAYA